MKANFADSKTDFQPIRVTVTLESQDEVDAIKFIADHIAGSELAEAYAGSFLKDDETLDFDTLYNSLDKVEGLCIAIAALNI